MHAWWLQLVLYCLADEIDAIGKARGPMSNDPGTQEREQGLLQLLCEMDGFRTDHRVRHRCCQAISLQEPPLPWHMCLTGSPGATAHLVAGSCWLCWW